MIGWQLKMTNEEFYRRCADMLGTSYDCTGLSSPYRTRWNNRSPGHGRFPGFGIIRAHGESVHVSLRRPIAALRHFDTRAAALDWLSSRLVEAA